MNEGGGRVVRRRGQGQEGVHIKRKVRGVEKTIDRFRSGVQKGRGWAGGGSCRSRRPAASQPEGPTSQSAKGAVALRQRSAGLGLEPQPLLLLLGGQFDVGGQAQLLQQRRAATGEPTVAGIAGQSSSTKNTAKQRSNKRGGRHSSSPQHAAPAECAPAVGHSPSARR